MLDASRMQNCLKMLQPGKAIVRASLSWPTACRVRCQSSTCNYIWSHHRGNEKVMLRVQGHIAVLIKALKHWHRLPREVVDAPSYGSMTLTYISHQGDVSAFHSLVPSKVVGCYAVSIITSAFARPWGYEPVAKKSGVWCGGWRVVTGLVSHRIIGS